MSRIISVIFALALLIALLVAVDPDVRRKAVEAVQGFEATVRTVNVDVEPANPTSTPGATATPFATPVDDDNNIDEDSSDEPIIVINWDALGDSLRNLWESLKQVKIDINPRDNK